ncbi:hypothetical protein DV515_00005906 [Chloebia gouldiae]|uniref:Reverse transcriptase domain-containing protein n=1 Tax=Chloebia gouldiae TaxID=44316 RepID=A0A3L8SLN8_CHLGU|nr:hypothetical protein DV515_00005906 [Chloebia gouldiae]
MRAAWSHRGLQHRHSICQADANRAQGSTGDIRRKVQKIREETLLGEAWRVFSNREERYKRGMKNLTAKVQEERREKHESGQGPSKQGPPRLGRNQRANCNRQGHWKKDCPERKQKGQENQRRGVVAHVQEDWGGGAEETTLAGPLVINLKLEEMEKEVKFLVDTGAIEVTRGTETDEEIMNQVIPGVWASDVPRRAKNAPPIQIRLKEGKQPVRVKQYPLRREDKEGIIPVIENFLCLGLLKECQSDFNTPTLPVHKPEESYQLVQDLQAVNKVTENLYPVLANPYTQKIFAFEWESPKSGQRTQLTWTRLQGFKNSLTLFREQLAKELETWEAPPEEGKLLQYVDDILIATWTREACVAWTVSLLNFLGLQGYWVSKKKA